MCNDDRWQQLADELEITDLDIDLLEQALSHASYVPEGGGAAYVSNQRLEFLLYNDSNNTKAYRSLHLWVDVQ